MKNRKYGSLPGVSILICWNIFILIQSIDSEIIWKIVGSSISLVIFITMFVAFYKKLQKNKNLNIIN